jgi:hypothetical protein
MKNKFEDLALRLGMVFSYGRRDHINLLNFADGDTTRRFILFPLKETNNFSADSGFKIKTIYSGSFGVVERSSLDEYYNEQKGDESEGKYKKHIEPIKLAVATMLDEIQCDNSLSVQSWVVDEVINLLDFNADGVIVSFSIVWDGRAMIVTPDSPYWEVIRSYNTYLQRFINDGYTITNSECVLDELKRGL